jgi:hypothetical protein
MGRAIPAAGCNLPALVRCKGYEIADVDDLGRPRRSVGSNYGLLDRLWIEITDRVSV